MERNAKADMGQQECGNRVKVRVGCGIDRTCNTCRLVGPCGRLLARYRYGAVVVVRNLVS